MNEKNLNLSDSDVFIPINNSKLSFVSSSRENNISRSSINLPFLLLKDKISNKNDNKDSYIDKINDFNHFKDFLKNNKNNFFEHNNQKLTLYINKKSNSYDDLMKIRSTFEDIFNLTSIITNDNFKNSNEDTFNNTPLNKENNLNDKECIEKNIKREDSLNIFPNEDDYFNKYKSKVVEEKELALNKSTFSITEKFTSLINPLYDSSSDSSTNSSPIKKLTYFSKKNNNLDNNSDSNNSPLKKNVSFSPSSECSSISNRSINKVKKQLFFSHSWEQDELNRNNHLRVKELVKVIKQFGWTTWFDEYDMGHNIDVSLSDGIEDSEAIIICLTKSYLDKVNNNARIPSSRDNCLKEWNYATSRKKAIIPIIMDESLKDIKKWPSGVINIYLANLLYIDYSRDNILDVANLLHKYLKKINLRPFIRLGKKKLLRLKDKSYLEFFYFPKYKKVLNLSNNIRNKNKEILKNYYHSSIYSCFFFRAFYRRNKRCEHKIKV